MRHTLSRPGLAGLLLALCATAPMAQAQGVNIAPDILAVPKDAPPIKPAELGPYKPVVLSEASLPTHTVYRPEDLTPFKGGKRLPIVAWGNGACANVGTYFQVFLTKVASEGFMVIAIGPKDAVRQPAQPGSAIPPPATKASQLNDAIDWAIAENRREGSPYYGRLDPKKVAVMGQSCGGLQAIEASSDPRVKTTMIWNSGVLNEEAPGRPKLSNATKDSLKAFHAPVAYILGGPIDVAYPNGEDDFRRIGHVPVFKANLNVGHGGTFRHPNGGRYADVASAWLKWRLNGDRKAGKMFDGPNCGLCVDPVWKVEKKQMR